jgi:biopolymer transport protein ExbD
LEGIVPKVRKKRVGFVLDMTPLVDITILLLSFFMMTAKFKSQAEGEQKFSIKRPQATADTSKLPDKDLALVKVAIDSVTTDPNYYFDVTNQTDKAQIWERLKTTLPAEALAKSQICLGKNLDALSSCIAATRITGPKRIKFAIEADKRIKYKWVADAMEVMRKNLATTFNYVTEKRQ